MKKKSQAVDKGWLSNFVVGQGLTFPHYNTVIVLRNVTRNLGGAVVNPRVVYKAANFSIGFNKLRFVLSCTVRKDWYL